MELGTLLRLVGEGGPYLPALLLAYAWHTERKERKELQEARDLLLERVLTTMNQATTTLEAWRRIWGG